QVEVLVRGQAVLADVRDGSDSNGRASRAEPAELDAFREKFVRVKRAHATRAAPPPDAGRCLALARCRSCRRRGDADCGGLLPAICGCINLGHNVHFLCWDCWVEDHATGVAAKSRSRWVVTPTR